MSRKTKLRVLEMLGWVVLLCLVWLPAGCDSAQYDQTLTMLKEGNAAGHLVITGGGSPLQAGAKTLFFLGAENMSLSFDGSIDFGSVSADDLLTSEEVPDVE
jgi:hypothetical protein